MSGPAHLALGGVVIPLRPGDSFTWEMFAGTQPAMTNLTVDHDTAEKIYQRAGVQHKKIDPRKTQVRGETQPVGPLTLEMDGGEGDPVKVKYEAEIRAPERDEMVAALKKELDMLQDAVDEFNAKSDAFGIDEITV